MSTSLKEFKELINDINDSDMLNVAEELLNDMISIKDMEEKISNLESELSKGKKAAFWFFTVGLDREQINLATDAVLGRKRILKDREDKKNLAESLKESSVKEEESDLLEI